MFCVDLSCSDKILSYIPFLKNSFIYPGGQYRQYKRAANSQNAAAEEGKFYCLNTKLNLQSPKRTAQAEPTLRQEIRTYFNF